jgi:hypothetical protein
MSFPKPGYVDFYYQGRIFEVEEQEPRRAAERITALWDACAQAGNEDALRLLRTQYHIREVGMEAEAGTDDLRNPLWLKIDTSRRLVGRTGRAVDAHVADLIRSAGIVGDGVTGNPVAFCIPDPRSGKREIWHVRPREIEALSRRQIEEKLVRWVTEAIEAGKLP